jgi:conjugative relaxase-like TrwC/TraI family protein
MISLTPVLRPQLDYYRELTTPSHEIAGGEALGAWMGRGATMLGLPAIIAEGDDDDIIVTKTFDALSKGRHPTTDEPLRQSAQWNQEQPLGVIAGSDPRKPSVAWDVTITAPKDISILWALGSPEQRAVIETSHRTAVRRAVAFLEEHALVTRRGVRGIKTERVGGVIAAFEHGTSRSQDPLLHTHLLVFNAGLRQDGTWGALRSRDLYVYSRALDAVYLTELTASIRQALAIPMTDNMSEGLRVRSVSTRLRDAFSNRSRAIESKMEAWNTTGGISARLAVLATRHRKMHVAAEALRRDWHEVAALAGARVERLFQPRVQLRAINHERIQQWVQDQTVAAVQRLVSMEGIAKEPNILALVFTQARNAGLPVSQVHDAIKATLHGHADISTVQRRGAASPEYTSRQMVELEARLLTSARELCSQGHRLNWLYFPEKFYTFRSGLNAEQLSALRHILDLKRDLVCVDGLAGTGKTTLLRTANRAFAMHGNRVIGLAVTGGAAKGLTQHAYIKESMTVSMLLARIDDCTSRLIPRENHPLRGRPVLLLDEASLLGTVDAQKLFALAESWKCKVVLVGDTGQLSSVAAGGVFARMCKEHGAATLSGIERQRWAWMRDAVSQASQGNAFGAITEYALRGHLHMAATRARTLEMMAEQFSKVPRRERLDSAMIAATNADVDALNALAQQHKLRKNWNLSDRGMDANGNTFYSGDRVRFTANRYGNLNVRNGDMGVVIAILRCVGLSWANIRLDEKNDEGGHRTVVVPLHGCRDLTLGYAMTAHAAQGKTLTHSFVLIDPQATNQQSTYVQLSRHRESCSLFVDSQSAGEDLSELHRAVSRSALKQMMHDALDLTPGQKPDLTKVHPALKVNDWQPQQRAADSARGPLPGFIFEQLTPPKRVEQPLHDQPRSPQRGLSPSY